MEMRLRPAEEREAELSYGFLCEGREYMKAQGRRPWPEDYPTLALVRADIREQKGYLLEAAGVPIGYLYLSFDKDEAYEEIEGEWQSDGPYGVIHRMAIGEGGRGKGAAAEAFRLAREICLERGVHALRIDTDESNTLMQHVLGRSGFVFCGHIPCDGVAMRAYELDF